MSSVCIICHERGGFGMETETESALGRKCLARVSPRPCSARFAPPITFALNDILRSIYQLKASSQPT